jgi:hypothetical protein
LRDAGTTDEYNHRERRQERNRAQNVAPRTSFRQPTTIQSQDLLGVPRFHGEKKETAHMQYSTSRQQPGRPACDQKFFAPKIINYLNI